MERRFLLTVWLVSLTLTSVFGQSLRVTELPQQQFYVTPGQYSGIAWVSWDRYAVVDNEGVVYADGKLYVSAEGDQSIREYELDGNTTGFSFSIPADMGPWPQS